jgi:predicted Rossmann fold flavoprotein
MSKNIAIIGGGASGLVSAITAARAGNNITVYERNKKLGKKILATGNGRCNITNEVINISSYHGENLKFAHPALEQFSHKKAKNFFNEIGLEIETRQTSRCYPLSNQASSVTDLLISEAKRCNVKFILENEVSQIRFKDTQFIIENTPYDTLILATGSNAMPQLGSSDIGYQIASGFQHTLIKPFASLVQLVSEDKDLKIASGVKLTAHLELFVNNISNQTITGDLLFTNYGLSGSAILDLSRKASKALQKKQEVTIHIDLLPQYSLEGLKQILKKRVKLNIQDPVLWLSGMINKKLALLLLKRTNITTINHKSIHTLSYALKNFVVSIHDTRGEKGAEVMAGGINTKEINPHTMESKLQKGLFFCGEIVDIDGDCGGYNLHWAWASGFLAGKSV